MLALLSTLVTGQTDWQTDYEKSGFVDSGRYEEAIGFCRRLAKASNEARLITIGKSAEGREIVALLMSARREFDAKQIASSPRPFIVINNGIHSGEIEGKDAGLILAREILISKREHKLIENANIAFIPAFNVDGLERFGPFNRINQNGPRQMGWRSTAQNYNLNRDFIKADAPEMRAMLRFLHTYKPDFFFDNHTTDGADYQYVVQYSVPTPALQDPGVASWTAGMVAAVMPKVDADGFLTAPYFDMVDRMNPAKGISVGTLSPRFSTGYITTLNRPSMLVETHMLKPFKLRVEATYSINKRTIEYCAATAVALKRANRQADAAEMNAKPGDQVPLDAYLTNATEPFTFKALEAVKRASSAAGAEIVAWSQKPIDVPSKVRREYRATTFASLPAAYAVPPQYGDVIQSVRLRGLKTRTLTRPLEETFETYRLEGVQFGRQPFEGRFQPSFKSVSVSERRVLPSGTVIVTTNQVGAKLLANLLEPQAPDSLASWGFFNGIFEQKEYFEDYAMAPLADKMLESDPQMKADFQARLKDPTFASSPQQRLDFFYRRSPYWDVRLNAYPIVRLSAKQLESAKVRFP